MTTLANTKIELTQEGYQETVKELEELRAKLQPAIDRVALARSYGDLSENAEYHSAREDLSLLESRIEELERVIANAKVLKQSGTKSSIKVGSHVSLKHNKKTVKYQVVTAWEADPLAQKISVDSPIGKALIGKKQGDQFTVEVPAGQQSYEILKIE